MIWVGVNDFHPTFKLAISTTKQIFNDLYVKKCTTAFLIVKLMRLLCKMTAMYTHICQSQHLSILIGRPGTPFLNQGPQLPVISLKSNS